MVKRGLVPCLARRRDCALVNSPYNPTQMPSLDHISADVLEKYFGTIERAFNETRISQDAKDWLETVAIVAIILFALSVVGAIPFGLSRLVPVLAKSDSGTLFHQQIPLRSFWFWWIACLGLTGGSVALIVRLLLSRGDRRRKGWLPEPQVRFAACYAIPLDIRRYQTNRLPRHIDEALCKWSRLRPMIFSMLRPFGYPMLVSPSGANAQLAVDIGLEGAAQRLLFGEVHALEESLSWFQLDAQTAYIVRAFEEFSQKINDRLKDKKDLGAVANALLFLSGYLYSKIPDALSPAGADTLPEFGTSCLLNFSAEVQSLAPYRSESKSPVGSTRFWSWISETSRRVPGLFSHQNLLACFLAWYFVILVLVVIALKVTLHFFPAVVMDSVIVTTLVGCPAICAVTAVAVSRRRNWEERATRPKTQSNK